MHHFEFLAKLHEEFLLVGSQGRINLRPTHTRQDILRSPQKHSLETMYRIDGQGKQVPWQKKCVMCPVTAEGSKFRTSYGCKSCGVWLCKKHHVEYHVSRNSTETNNKRKYGENKPPGGKRRRNEMAIVQI